MSLKRCLFVASGPSAGAAEVHRPWGDLVTLNRALELFDRVDLAFFGTAGKVMDTQAHLHKAAVLVPLFTAEEKYAELALPILEQTGRMVLPIGPAPPAVREAKGDRFVTCRAVIEAGGVLGRAGLAVMQLQRRGYTALWLFGHDGGHDRAAPLLMSPSRRGYDKSQFCTQTLLEHLGLAHSFWPNPAPVANSGGR